MTRIDEIKKRLKRVPKLYAVGDDVWDRAQWGDRDEWWGAFTVSPDRAKLGWRTDGGCDGYGLPKQVAEDIAMLRDDVEWLLDELETAKGERE